LAQSGGSPGRREGNHGVVDEEVEEEEEKGKDGEVGRRGDEGQ